MRRTAILAGLLALSVAAPASAHHHGGLKVERIAQGLDNPRHVAVAPDGDVWVAEAGSGAPPSISRSCFDSAEGPACTGKTGAITKIDRWGQRRVVTGLASFAPASGDSAIGPHGIFAGRGNVFFTNGGPTEPLRGGKTVLRDPTLVSEEPISRLYGTLRVIGRHGRTFKLADIWRAEFKHNWDAAEANDHIDSNPVDVLADHGRLYVADAGGNTLLKVGPFGRVRPLAIFPNKTVPDPFGGPDDSMQAVPTGVVKGPDGALYMSQLTGFPFPIGGANVYRVDPRTGAVSIYATGFTNIMDLDFGRNGTLYVLEIDADSLIPPIGPSTDGGLFTVPWHRGAPIDGTPVALPAGTLTEPGGLAVGKRGELYVSNHGRQAGVGEVLRISLG
jgi:DNA-binding beta-propeller fold protein YncE